MTITIKREYSILPQGERDDFHHHIRDKGQGATYQYACFVSLIILVILLVLAGVATLTATMFFSDGIKTTFGQLWFDTSTSEMSNHMGISGSDSSTPLPSSTSISNPNSNSDAEGRGSSNENEGSSEENENSADNPDENNTSPKSNKVNSNSENIPGIGDGSGSSDSDSQSSGDSDIEYSGNSTSGSNGTMDNFSNSEGTVNSGSGQLNDMDVEKMKEKFAEAMRNLEKHMEDVMGIRRAEFVIPIFMLACFLFSFSLISLCCCFMMRRRENRRKKLFGKLITDLQTGDSKTVLLNHSDLDD